MKSRFLIEVLPAATVLLSHGEILFEQDFSNPSSGPVTPYVSSSPSRGQWNAIGGTISAVNISDGQLRYTRNGSGTGFFARTTDLSPTPSVLVYNFDLTATPGGSATTGAARWQVGSGFTTSSGAETTGVRAEFGLNFAAGGGFSLRYLGASGSPNGPVMDSKQNVTWVINNSGSLYSYLGPNNVNQTVASGHWDLWEGWQRVFDEEPLLSGSQGLTDLKFAFTQGSGTIQMDNFRLETVPEPATTGVVAALFLLGVAGLKQFKANRSIARKQLIA